MAAGLFEGKRILIMGGTGSLGSALLRRLREGRNGAPSRIVIFSRDEGKQDQLRSDWGSRPARDHESRAAGADGRLEFCIGDIRDYHAVAGALRDIDIVFNAAALKQVPTCEYFPYEAVLTNIMGAENVVRAICNYRLPVATVVGISTDKAVSPVNVLGMTKGIQERIFARASLAAPETRFIVVRYGNVLASRGSVVPIFLDQISRGGPVTVTDTDMTRFLLGVDDALTVIVDALAEARTGEIYVPRLRGARVVDVATALIGARPIKVVVTGLRPGEKLHEVLISEEERHRTFTRGSYYVIAPMLPELMASVAPRRPLERQFASNIDLMSPDEVHDLIDRCGLMTR